MKTIYTLLSFLLLLTVTSCKKDAISHSADYNNSYYAWLDFKGTTNNSYRYTVSFGSWTGYGTETVITVQNGKVAGRSFVAKQHPNMPNAAIVILAHWTEDESSLNTHDAGAVSRTLDEVYQLAKEDWLKKRSDADTYFEAGNNGLLSSAGYVPKGCQDDCFRGISITKIEAL